MNEEIDTTTLSVRYVNETEMAILLAFEDEDWEEHWVPKSVVEESSFGEDDGEAVIRDWWLETKGII